MRMENVGSTKHVRPLKTSWHIGTSSTDIYADNLLAFFNHSYYSSLSSPVAVRLLSIRCAHLFFVAKYPLIDYKLSMSIFILWMNITCTLPTAR